MSLEEKISSKKAKVAVYGVGYVGLPTCVLLVEKGFQVIAVDVNPRIVELTNRGESHINDEFLRKSVNSAWKTGRLKATSDTAQAGKDADIIIISVPTPSENNKPDLKYVEKACEDIAQGLRGSEKLVIVESTVYPSACRKVLKPILEKEGGKCGKDFYLAHCPERLNPGDNDHNVRVTPRIVGGIDEKSGILAQKFYESYIDAKIFRMSSLDAAELVKLVENTQRDVNIAFMNEVALICEHIGVEVKEVIEGCATKWNFYKVLPGPGVGGHCLPNNPYYILKRAEERGFEPKLLLLSRKLNDSMMHHVVELIEKTLGSLKGKRIAVMGVAYKANVDDVRQSPARGMIPELLSNGSEVIIFDPYVNEVNKKKVHSAIASSFEEAVKECDCVVFLCAHDEFKKIKLEQIRKLNPKASVVDTSFLFDWREAERLEIKFEAVGLGRISD